MSDLSTAVPPRSHRSVMQHLSRCLCHRAGPHPCATHEVPSHSPDSLPSTNFCSRLFQPSHHLPLLLRPYRSQLHVAGRRRRAAAAAAARATAIETNGRGVGEEIRRLRVKKEEKEERASARRRESSVERRA